MSTLLEIELAARELSPAEKQELLLFVAQNLRAEGVALPEPRRFSATEMEGWMEEDDRDLRKLQGHG